MKKTFIVMLALLLSIAFLSTAFAGNKIICDTCTTASTTFGGGEYRPSSKVSVDITTDAAGLAYCATSQHSGASTNQTAGRQFGTMSISPQIMYAPSETTAGPKACTDERTMATPTSGSWQ